MIEEIRIRNLGVIAEATLPLGPGLSVVTGETGAGKTMVVTAVGLLLGGRADAGAVRVGAKSASAEASLVLPEGHAALSRAQEAGAETETFDGGSGRAVELILGRTVNSDGRSRAQLGGRSAPIGTLAEVGEALVVVHGQSDQIRLKSASAQRHALDSFAGEALAAKLAEYQLAYHRWQDAAAELETIQTTSRERLREAESLREALREIDALEPEPAEDETLKAESIKLSNVEGLRLAVTAASEALVTEDFGDGDDATTLVDTAKRALESVAEHDETLRESAAQLREAGILLADVATSLGSYSAALDADPGRLAAIEDRRGALAVLLRKYAPTIDEVLAWADEARARLELLSDDSARIAELGTEVAELDAALTKQAQGLTSLRTKAAKSLGQSVSAELKALAMPDATLHILIEPAGQRTLHGADTISFRLQPHQGSEPRPLGKGASGGELSRVMLAIEVVLAAVDPVPTFVFDEVDSGVGGKAAVEIGRRLAMLAQHVQVLVVTHLPQVAAFADRHIQVTKTSGDGFTSSDVVLLDDEGRVRELARMLAGQEESTTAQAHAQELLADARINK